MTRTLEKPGPLADKLFGERTPAPGKTPVVPDERFWPEMREVSWPALSVVGLDAAQQDARQQGIGGSDANVILSGDPNKVRNLWLEKRGEKPPGDLSDVLPVILGAWTEPFNRQWYEKASGYQVSQVGQVLTSHSPAWRRCIRGSTAKWPLLSAMSRPR